MNLSIGVTGHRDLVPELKSPPCVSKCGLFSGNCVSDFPELQLQLLTPLAEGADRLVTEVAQEMGIPFVVVLPMFQEIYEKDFDGEESLILFRQATGRCRIGDQPASLMMESIPLTLSPMALRVTSNMSRSVFLSPITARCC